MIPRGTGNKRLAATRWWRLTLTVATLVMIGLARGSLPGRAVPFCGTAAGCDDALAHPLAWLFGLPVSLWTLAAYLILFQCPPHHWHLTGRRRIATLTTLLLLFGSAGYLLVMYRDLVTPCRWCLAGHGLHGLLGLQLLAGCRQDRRLPSPVPALAPIFLPPLLLLLTGSALLHHPAPVTVDAGLRMDLHRALFPDFDRFFPAAPHQYIIGSPERPYQLTVIGSLACRHCRDLLAALLPDRQAIPPDIAVAFIPFPLCSRCNPRAAPDTGARRERCLLAAATDAAQRQGRFWPWLQHVSRAPGLVQRRLAQQPSPAGNERSMAHLAGLDNIPVPTLPTLIWQGRPLPSRAAALPVRRLIDALRQAEETVRRATPPTDPCGSC